MKLTEEDQLAVLCILSHGGDQTIYGTDGKSITVMELLKSFDNFNCVQMAGKPKIAIVQACQGGSYLHIIVYIRIIYQYYCCTRTLYACVVICTLNYNFIYKVL